MTGSGTGHGSPLDALRLPGCTCTVTSSMSFRIDRACPVHGRTLGSAVREGPVPGGLRPTIGLRQVGLDRTLELAHLLAIITKAADLLHEHGCDIDSAILRAHGAELAAGREWPGTPIRSTLDFDAGT